MWAPRQCQGTAQVIGGDARPPRHTGAGPLSRPASLSSPEDLGVLILLKDLGGQESTFVPKDTLWQLSEQAALISSYLSAGG